MLRSVLAFAAVVWPLAAASALPFGDLDADKQKTVARKLYELGYGSSARANPADSLPTWVVTADRAGSAIAVRAWRAASGLSPGDALNPGDADKLLATRAPSRWAAIARTVGSQSSTDGGYIAARTWNRPSRMLAERVVIDRCEQKAADQKVASTCHQHIVLATGRACIGLALVLPPTGSNQPVEGHATLRPNDRLSLDGDLAVTCWRFQPAACAVKHIACADGRSSF